MVCRISKDIVLKTYFANKNYLYPLFLEKLQILHEFYINMSLILHGYGKMKNMEYYDVNVFCANAVHANVFYANAVHANAFYVNAFQVNEVYGNPVNM